MKNKFAIKWINYAVHDHLYIYTFIWPQCFHPLNNQVYLLVVSAVGAAMQQEPGVTSQMTM